MQNKGFKGAGRELDGRKRRKRVLHPEYQSREKQPSIGDPHRISFSSFGLPNNPRWKQRKTSEQNKRREFVARVETFPMCVDAKANTGRHGNGC